LAVRHFKDYYFQFKTWLRNCYQEFDRIFCYFISFVSKLNQTFNWFTLIVMKNFDKFVEWVYCLKKCNFCFNFVVIVSIHRFLKKKSNKFRI
jgi:hypothetical protein